MNVRRYKCSACNYIYDPREGDRAVDIPPMTGFEDIIESWVCPQCGAPKSAFEPDLAEE